MSSISTHILDISIGRPANGVSVVLDVLGNDQWLQIGSGSTDADGRLREFVADGGSLEVGAYRLRFDTAEYFRGRNVESFYPEVVVTFTIADSSQHYHVPLLLSPFGYSTYRGS